MFFIFLLACISYVSYLLYRNRRGTFSTCEDSYQHRRKQSNHRQSDIIAVIQYQSEPVSKLDLQQKLSKVERDLVDCSSPESHLDPENMFTSLDEFRNCETYNMKGYLDYQSKKFVYYINHEFIGGSKLAHSFQIVNKTPQKLLFYRTRWWYAFAALKLWWNRDKIPQVPSTQLLPLYQTDVQVRRYVKTYTIDKCTSLKATILCNVLRDIHSALKLQRPLVCYLPIAFYPSKTVNNNIGLMWLTFDPDADTVQTVADRLNANMYQVLATNFLLYYNMLGTEKGSQTRKAVDAVVTMIFTEEEENIVKSWTFQSVSEYPVYAAVSPVIDQKQKLVHITQTLTVSTPRFDFFGIPQYTPQTRDFYLI